MQIAVTTSFFVFIFILMQNQLFMTNIMIQLRERQAWYDGRGQPEDPKQQCLGNVCNTRNKSRKECSSCIIIYYLSAPVSNCGLVMIALNIFIIFVVISLPIKKMLSVTLFTAQMYMASQHILYGFLVPSKSCISFVIQVS